MRLNFTAVSIIFADDCSNHFSHDVVFVFVFFFNFVDPGSLQPKTNLFGGAMVN